MDATEFISPGGVVQVVESPTTAVRLRAAGWWPLTELQKAAEHDQQAAVHLQQVTEARTALEERRNARLASHGLASPQPTPSAPAASKTAKTTKPKPAE